MTFTFDDIVLTILGIASVRQAIAQNFDLPIPSKLRWIIYDKKADRQPVLCKRAHELSQSMEAAKYGDPLDEWLGVVGRNIKHYPGGIMHGSEGKKIKSDYFVDTLAASYSGKDLKAMAFIVRRIISANMDDPTDIDFVVCRKNGNTKLVERVFQDAGDNVTMICYHDKRSGFPMHVHYSAEYLNSDYENLERLREAAAVRDSMHKLNGIVIDCSVSTGNGLNKMIKAFNTMVKDNNLNINPIEHAFVMHTNGGFNDEGIDFRLHRLVDMDETTRKLVHDASDKGTKDAYKSVKAYLKSKKLYHPL